MLYIVQLPATRIMNCKKDSYSPTPQASAISFVSHHFVDEFGQSMVKPPVINNTSIVETISEKYILSEIK